MWESVDKDGNRIAFNDDTKEWITLDDQGADNNKQSDSGSSSKKSSSSKSSEQADPTSKYMIIFQDGQYAVFEILQVDNEVITKMKPIIQFDTIEQAKNAIKIMESVV